jgi:hypothetical protein
MTKEFKIGKFWLIVGVSKRFAIGISISKYSMDIDLICFWITVEF